MQPELHERRLRVRAILTAITIVLVIGFAIGGIFLLGRCDECGGTGMWHLKCHACNGQGALFGQPCMTCGGSGETTSPCYNCGGRGRAFGLGGLVVRVIHLLIVLGIILLTALGIYLLTARRVAFFNSRELRRPTTHAVGLCALLAAAALVAVEALMGMLFLITGMGPEGPSRNQAANNKTALGFAVAAVIVGGVFLLAGGLTARAGARPRGEAGRAHRGMSCGK
jgi:hypothetical protein